jgi:hypothetical protein
VKEIPSVREKKPTRRQFAKNVVALAAAPVAASAAPAQEPTTPARPATPGQALAELIRIRYSQHLTADQLRRVTQRVENNFRMADRLKRTTLQNGEEPAFEFTADLP